MAQLPQVQPFQTQLSGVSSAATPTVGFGQRVDAGMPFRAQAQYQNVLAEQIDRMSNVMFGYAEKTAGMAAEKFALDNPLTQEQLTAMAVGDTSKVDLGSPLNVYSAVMRKARAIELSGYMEMNARKELLKIYDQADKNLITAEQAKEQITALINADAQVVGQVSTDAALRYRASMATLGSQTVANIAGLELKRDQLNRQQMVADDFENIRNAAYSYITSPLPINPDTGQEWDLNTILDTLVQNFKGTAETHVGALEANTYEDKLKADILAMKQTALQEYFTQERYMENPRLVAQEIKAGQAGNLSQVLQEFKFSPDGRKILDEVIDYNLDRVDKRKRGIELALVDDAQRGNALLSRMYSTSDRAEHQRIFNEMTTLALDPGMLKSARDFMMSANASGPMYDDLNQLGELNTKIALGQATQSDINNATGLKFETKRSLTLQLSNPTDPLRYGAQQINYAVGIQSADLPPEIDSADGRQLAVSIRNSLLSELNEFARTPDANGRFPSPPEIQAKGRELSKNAESLMSPMYRDLAAQMQNQVILSIPTLQGVDLSDQAAVSAAIAEFQSGREVSSSTTALINSAKLSIDKYRQYINKANQGAK